MRIALVMGEGFPNPTTGGGALTAWTITQQAIAEGHDVCICVVHMDPYSDPLDRTIEERTAALEAIGAEVVALPSRAGSVPREGGARARVRRQVRPRPVELFPYMVDAEAVRSAVDGARPDAVFAYHVEAVAATRLVRAPRFAAIGDPSHLPLLYRWKLNWPSVHAARALPTLSMRLRHEPRLLVELLRECRVTGAFAAHHAEWLRTRGVEGCLYLHTPVPDPGPVRWTQTDSRPPRILLLGHLRGTVTMQGLRLFARETLPRLEQELGPEGFETRIVGGYELPPDLARALDRPSVVLAGHTEDAAEELLAADCLVVPTSIPLGIRVRIITAFSHGAPVVTHRANGCGIPELEHDDNVLLAASGQGLAEQILRLLSHEGLAERIGAGGRATYERAFAPPVAAGEIVARLVQVAAPE